MMMYKCNDCNYVFDKPIIEYDDPSPKGVALPSGYYIYWYCPKCYGGNIEGDYDENEME